MTRDLTVAQCILLIDLVREKVSTIQQIHAMNGTDKLEGLEADIANDELYTYQNLLRELLE